MSFKNSEGVAFLADHIKSIWSLSAGGIAFGSGLLGLISKDVNIPWYEYVPCLLFVVGGLCAYTFSVYRGLEAHKQLADEVFRSEDEQQSITKTDERILLDKIQKIYKRSRSSFFVGCFALAVGVLGFVICNNVLTKVSKTGYLAVSLKDATVVTRDSQKIQIENLTFKITDPRSLSSKNGELEIHDLAFKGHTLQSVP